VIAIDTNLLIYAHRSGMPEHTSAMRAIEAASLNRRGWGIAAPCIAEFWRVVTHPASLPRPSKPREAAAFLKALIDAEAKIFYPHEGFAETLAEEACAQQLAGGRIFDLQIAVIVRQSGGSQIWTHDSRFVTVNGLRVVDPF